LLPIFLYNYDLLSFIVYRGLIVERLHQSDTSAIFEASVPHLVLQGETMEQQILSQGTVLGQRFEIIAYIGEEIIGKTYKARDTDNDRIVSLCLLPGTTIGDDSTFERLREHVKAASDLTQRNIRAVLGMGKEADGSIYIASEWVEGQSLRNVLQKRIEANKKFSFKGAYNIMGHVCNALSFAHQKSAFHGTLCPSSIIVNNAGRIKIGGWELPVDIASKALQTSKNTETVFWAPEIVKSSNCDKLADIYSLGALFYELITGVAPERPLKAPSVLGFSKDVDTVIARCMAGVSNQRYSDPASVKSAISQLVNTEETEATKEESDDDLSIDVVVSDSLIPPPAQERSTANSSMLNAPGLPPPPGGDSSPDMGRVSNIDMGALLGSLGKSESAHWMVQKDKFDHGPFSDRELVQQIMSGEVLGKHSLLDMDNGVRKKVRSWGHFNEYLEQYRVSKKKREEAAALEKTKRSEKRGTAFTALIVGGIITVIAVVGGGFIYNLKFRKETKIVPDDVVAALDSGEIKLKYGGSKGKRKKGRGKRGRGKPGTKGYIADGLSAEEAMQLAVDIGDLKNSGGQKQLTEQDILAIMDRKVRRFLPCMSGQSVSRVDIDLVIGGDGRVIGATAKQGSSKLKQCVQNKVRSIKFPASSAPRTAASWYFEIEW